MLDDDGDGLPNLLEYALGTNPQTANPIPLRIVGVDAGRVTLEFSWNRQDTRLSWAIHHGADLSNPAIWPAVSPGSTTITPEGNLDRITVTPALTTPTGFYRLKVLASP